MAFFTKDFISFFKELKENNHKEWFDANRKRYIQSVKEPFEAFVNHMIDRVREDDPKVMITPNDGDILVIVFFQLKEGNEVLVPRMKTPYKTNVSAIISQYGKKDKTSPGMYFELKPDEVRFYGGVYMLDKDQLHKVRTAIASDLSGFEAALNDPAFKQTFETLHGEQNKRIPKEFREVQEKQPLIANKSFYYYTILPAKLITSDKLADELMALYHSSRPMREWLTDAIN